MNVLFLTHRLPYAPNRGDRIRANYILRVLSEKANVHLASLVHSREEASQGVDIQQYVQSLTLAPVPIWRNRIRAMGALAGRQPLTHVLLDSPALRAALPGLVERHKPDVVLAFCSSMARYALEPCLAGVPFVLDMVDVDSAKWRTLAGRASGWKSAIYDRESRVLLDFERRACAIASATVVVTERETEELVAAGITGLISVIPIGVDTEYLQSHISPSAVPRVILTGVMDYFPNVDAALWFTSAIWPLVRRTVSDATLIIAGANPARAVRRLADPASGIEVTGSLPDLRPCLWNAAVAVAPLRIARGVQNKVVEAVAAGVPVVSTSIAAGGIPNLVKPACRIADEPAAFAAAVVELLRQEPSQRRAIASSVDVSSFHFRRTLSPLVSLLSDAASRRLRAA